MGNAELSRLAVIELNVIGGLAIDIYEKIMKVKSAIDHLDMLVQESQTWFSIIASMYMHVPVSALF